MCLDSLQPWAVERTLRVRNAYNYRPSRNYFRSFRFINFLATNPKIQTSTHPLERVSEFQLNKTQDLKPSCLLFKAVGLISYGPRSPKPESYGLPISKVNIAVPRSMRCTRSLLCRLPALVSTALAATLAKLEP